MDCFIFAYPYYTTKYYPGKSLGGKSNKAQALNASGRLCTQLVLDLQKLGCLT